jgi:hypothetical protein
MRRTPSSVPALGLALALILAGCDAVAPTSVEPILARQVGHQPVPLKGSCELAMQPAEPIGPGIIWQRDVGSCQLTHLGRADFVSDKVIDVWAGTQTAQVTLTAANGDLLHANGAGTSTLVAPGRFAFRAVLTLTGGTGRFSAAAGEVVSEGEADLVSGIARLTMAGWIAY